MISKSQRKDFLFSLLSFFALLVGLATLFALLFDLFIHGSMRLDHSFMVNFPSRFPEKSGILSAWVGSVLVMIVTACVSIPLGIAAGVYLEEYAPKNFLTAIIEINISNLAGVPSIIYGLLALGLFVYQLDLGHSILTGGLTLALLILPVIIVSTREAIKTIPNGIRDAAYALGATKWQMVKDHVVPYSLGGISTGIIIGLSRAIGETAPLITIGALTFIAFLPASPFTPEFPWVSFQWLHDSFTVLPVQMFNWISRPQEEFHANAAAAGLVLLALTLSLNALAIYVRQRFRNRIKW